MTKKEAKEKLYMEWQKFLENNIDYAGISEAYKMAFKALDQESKITEQWKELKETITELRDNDGTSTQHEICKFLVNYMNILEKQMQEPCDDVISRGCNNCVYYINGANDEACDGCFADEYEHPNFKPKAQPYEDYISK